MKITDRFRKMCVSCAWLQGKWKKGYGDWFYHPEQQVTTVRIPEGISLVHPDFGPYGKARWRIDEIAEKMYWIPNLNQLMDLAREELGLDGYALRRDINDAYLVEQMEISDFRKNPNMERYWTELANDEIVLAYLMWERTKGRWDKRKEKFDFKKETWYKPE